MQMVPLPLTVACFSEIHIGFTFLVPSHPGSPRHMAVKWLLLLLLCSTCSDIVDAVIVRILPNICCEKTRMMVILMMKKARAILRKFVNATNRTNSVLAFSACMIGDQLFINWCRFVSEMADIAVLFKQHWQSVSRWLGLLPESRSSTQSVSSSEKKTFTNWHWILCTVGIWSLYGLIVLIPPSHLYRLCRQRTSGMVWHSVTSADPLKHEIQSTSMRTVHLLSLLELRQINTSLVTRVTVE